MKSARGFSSVILIVVIVVIAALAGSYYLLNQRSDTPINIEETEVSTQTSNQTAAKDPTANWIAFSELKQEEPYGFTFKYDANKYNHWKAIAYDLAWSHKGPGGEDIPDSIILRCEKAPFQALQEDGSAKTIKLGNKDAIYYTKVLEGQSYALVRVEGGVGNCLFGKNISLPGESEEFDLILSTFRFI